MADVPGAQGGEGTGFVAIIGTRARASAAQTHPRELRRALFVPYAQRLPDSGAADVDLRRVQRIDSAGLN